MAEDNSQPSLVVAVTGASGLVGKKLTARLESQGHLVRALVRRTVQDSDREIYWNPDKGEIDSAELNGVDAVIHLAGENIASARWSAEVKQKIRQSRIRGTQLLAETLAGLSSKPSTYLSASAIGYYGVRDDQVLTEKSPSGTGFLAEVCREWEQAAEPAIRAGIRTVLLRIGVVLSTEGGALKKMIPPFKMGAGGVLGSGKQYFSWIELDDLVDAIIFALTTPQLTGPVNCTAPEPATNREFTKALGSALGRPTILPMPSFMARLMFGGEMANEMMLGGARIVPQQLQLAGFDFDHPTLDAALRHILAK